MFYYHFASNSTVSFVILCYFNESADTFIKVTVQTDVRDLRFYVVCYVLSKTTKLYLLFYTDNTFCCICQECKRLTEICV